MNPFQRMLWKEYRAWRTLWLGCVLGTIALEAFCILLSVTMNPQVRGGWTMVLLSFGQVVPAIYILACTAATFAGEREERTAEWLSALAPRENSVIAAKLLFAAGSGLLMQIVLIGFAAALAPLDAEVQNGMAPYLQFMQQELVPISTCLVFEAVVWGTFWSLWTTHPLKSVILGAATLLLVNILAANVHGHSPNQYWEPRPGWAVVNMMWGPLRVALTLAVLAIDIVLARRWLNGRYLSWPTKALPLRWPRLLHMRHTAREAASAWQRAWQRLWWLELVHVRSFLLISLGMTVVAVGTLFLGANATVAMAVMIGSCIPMFGGLAAWQGEQRREQFRFYVDRGVPLAGLWLNKLLVWMVGALFATALLGGAVIGVWTVAHRYDQRKWPDLFPDVRGFLSQKEFLSILVFDVVGIVMVVAISFLCGQLFRRGVVAFGLALIASVLLGMALTFEYELGLPVLWFAVPIPLWLLWVSARQLSRSWREELRWPSRASLAAELLAPPLVWCVAAAAYRVYEVPVVDPAIAQSVSHDQQLTDTVRQALRESPALWSRIVSETRFVKEAVLSEKAGSHLLPPGQQPPTNHQPPSKAIDASPAELFLLTYDWPATAAKYPAELQRLSDDLLNANVMSPEAAIWRQVNLYDVGMVVALFGEMAEQQLERGHETVSAKWLQAAMRLAGRVTSFAPFDTREAVRKDILDDVVQLTLVHWAQHPLQSDDALRIGLTACAQEDYAWAVYPEELIAEWNQFRFKGPSAGSVLVPFFRSDYRWRPWELWRAERELAIMFTNQIDYLRLTRFAVNGQPSFGPVPESKAVHFLREPAAWDFRDRTSPYYYYVDRPLGLTPEAILSMYDRQTRFHGLCTAAAVTGFARVHGQLPVSLSNVAGYFGSETGILRDPWSGEDLRYLPEGIIESAFYASNGPRPADVHLEKRTRPIVWSVGPEQLQLQRYGQPLVFHPSIPGSDNLLYAGYGRRTGVVRYAFFIPELSQIEYVQRSNDDTIQTVQRGE